MATFPQLPGRRPERRKPPLHAARRDAPAHRLAVAGRATERTPGRAVLVDRAGRPDVGRAVGNHLGARRVPAVARGIAHVDNGIGAGIDAGIDATVGATR